MSQRESGASSCRLIPRPRNSPGCSGHPLSSPWASQNLSPLACLLQGQPPSWYQSKPKLAGGRAASSDLRAFAGHSTWGGGKGGHPFRPQTRGCLGKRGPEPGCPPAHSRGWPGEGKVQTVPGGPLVAARQSHLAPERRQQREPERSSFSARGWRGVQGTPLGRWVHRGRQVVKGAPRLGCSRAGSCRVPSGSVSAGGGSSWTTSGA